MSQGMKNWSKKRKMIMGGAVLLLCLVGPFGAKALFDYYPFRLWVCEVSQKKFCYDILPMPEEYRREVAKEWKEKTGKSINNF